MKKLISAILLSVLGFSAYADIKISKAYALKKDSYGIYVIRVLYNGTYQDWYVRPSENPKIFFGYEDDEKIIVDELIDIAIEY